MSNLRNHLQESHKDLTQWFLLHQECLLLNNDEFANKAFAAFSEYLQHHIEFENNIILTAMQPFEDRLRWKLHLYKKEHDKIEQLLGKLDSKLTQYYQMQDRRKRLALLAILESEQLLKHVMEHHEQREEDDLFIYFEELLSENITMQWLTINQQLTERHDEFKQFLKQFLEK